MYVLPVVGTSILEGLGERERDFVVVVVDFFDFFYLTLFCYRKFQECQEFSIKMCSDISAFCCSCRTHVTWQLMSYIIVSTNHTIGLWFSISSLRTPSGGDCVSKEERTYAIGWGSLLRFETQTVVKWMASWSLPSSSFRVDLCNTHLD